MKNINQIITSFLAAGGLGYINYWVLEKLDRTSSGSGEKISTVTFSSLLFSIPDFFVYLFFKWCLKAISKNLMNNDIVNFLALFLSILLIFFFTAFFGKKIIDYIYRLLRKITTNSFDTGVEPGEPWTIIDKTGENLVYLFSLDHKLIICGFGEDYSGEQESNYSINIQPSNEIRQHKYKQIVKNACYSDCKIDEFNCSESHIHVNLKQKFIMVIFKVKNKDK